MLSMPCISTNVGAAAHLSRVAILPPSCPPPTQGSKQRSRSGFTAGPFKGQKRNSPAAGFPERLRDVAGAQAVPEGIKQMSECLHILLGPGLGVVWCSLPSACM